MTVIAFTRLCGWLARWAVLTCLSWSFLTMASAYDPCPYGYYWVGPLEKCLPCRDICVPDRTAGCIRHCRSFSTTIPTTTVPTTTPATTAWTTVNPAANNDTDEGIAKLMIALIVVGVGLIVLIALVVLRCFFERHILDIVNRLKTIICKDATHQPVAEQGDEIYPMVQVLA